MEQNNCDYIISHTCAVVQDNCVLVAHLRDLCKLPINQYEKQETKTAHPAGTQLESAYIHNKLCAVLKSVGRLLNMLN